MAIFGTDGVRGKVGEYPITPDFALHLGWAAGCVLSKNGAKRVVVGKDTRNSGYMLESAIQAGLSAAGVDVLLTGPLPTPAIAYLTNTYRASAGVVISASHNPYYDNGIKFFCAKGEKLSDAVQAEIEEMLGKTVTGVAPEKLGKAYRMDDATGRYIEFCKSTFGNNLTLSGLKIVVDAAHGAAYKSLPAVISELGASVTTIGVDPNGLNINERCGATDVTQLADTVLAEGADLGLAVDGDGDRIIFVDHTGAVRDGDHLLYVIAKHKASRDLMSGGVVGTYMSNIGLEKAFSDIGIPFCRAKVGDRYVMEKMKAREWQLGGEPSGHIICRDKISTGDGIIAALQVLEAVVGQEKSLHELCSEWTAFPQTLLNVGVINKTISALDHAAVTDAVKKAEGALATHTDTPMGRVLLRASGTEPLIRVMVEAQSAELSKFWADEIAGAVQNVA
ncbi:phosphoglucosamine mutase [uncultured Zhongshania sp.]|uniref:phosphoglucosamine mutase n=1 Tax=uncultured Zhongshania sp. TaxID=1642288 RepID=UPI0025EE8018|nr:phosphoglucosamine mutase [uncultured Zhongshania sp.]